jgi:hypothetical protein
MKRTSSFEPGHGFSYIVGEVGERQIGTGIRRPRIIEVGKKVNGTATDGIFRDRRAWGFSWSAPVAPAWWQAGESPVGQP